MSINNPDHLKQQESLNGAQKSPEIIGKTEDVVEKINKNKTLGQSIIEGGKLGVEKATDQLKKTDKLKLKGKNGESIQIMDSKDPSKQLAGMEAGAGQEVEVDKEALEQGGIKEVQGKNGNKEYLIPIKMPGGQEGLINAKSVQAPKNDEKADAGDMGVTATQGPGEGPKRSEGDKQVSENTPGTGYGNARGESKDGRPVGWAPLTDEQFDKDDVGGNA